MGGSDTSYAQGCRVPRTFGSLQARISYGASRFGMVVTYGDLRRSPEWDGFRVDFESMEEIIFRARLSSRPGKGMLAGWWRRSAIRRSWRCTGSPTSRGGGVGGPLRGVWIGRETAW
jgi:hypothetical protein